MKWDPSIWSVEIDICTILRQYINNFFKAYIHKRRTISLHRQLADSTVQLIGLTKNNGNVKSWESCVLVRGYDFRPAGSCFYLKFLLSLRNIDCLYVYTFARLIFTFSNCGVLGGGIEGIRSDRIQKVKIESQKWMKSH